MPTTFRATSNAVDPVKVPTGSSVDEALRSNAAFARAFEKEDAAQGMGLFPRGAALKEPSCAKIIQSSAAGAALPAAAAPYGLVSAVVDAYNRHHNLVLRPDDVWQAILTQFAFYVNANAEALRDKFVDFEGKKTLVIVMGGTLFSADFGQFASRMVDEQICPNLKDADVTQWLLPSFSTTEPSDRVAASVTIMSTLQAYFEYVCCLMCGIPEVTLEGTVEDWQALRAKIDRLPSYEVEGNQFMAQWHALLTTVLDQFVAAASGQPDLAFWDRVCHRSGGGSGPSYLSGWVTVFACFTAKGNWQGTPRSPPVLGGPKQASGSTPEWPVIDTSYLPVGAVSVPVLVDDNGVQYDTQMVAGQVCYSAEGDRVRPRTDWCIAYEGAPKAEPRACVAGEIRPSGPSRAEVEAALEREERGLEEGTEA